MKRLYEQIDIVTSTESYGSKILRFFKKLGIGILVFAISIAIIAGLAQLGCNLGWNHNGLFLAGIRGATFGALGGAIVSARSMFNQK